jgi:competence protein ComEC
VDLRLFPLAIGLWISTAGSLIVGSTQKYFYLFLWLSALSILIFSLIKNQYFRYWNLNSTKFLAIGFITGVILASFRMAPLTAEPLSIAAKENAIIQVTGVLVTDPTRSRVHNALNLETRDFGSFKIRATEIKFRGQTYRTRIPIQVFVTGPQVKQSLGLTPGTMISFTGKFKSTSATRGVSGQLNPTGELQILISPPRYQDLATKFRAGLHLALAKHNQDVAGLVPGLALGDVSNLTDQLDSDMKASGLTHLTAVSGSNVSLLIVLVIAIGLKLGFTKRSNYLAALVVLAAFVVVVRPQPSVLRASVMGVVMVIALLTKSAKSPLPALTGSIIVLILVDPWLSISYGFALSVGATAGLLLWAKSLMASADRMFPKQIPGWLLLGLVVTLSAQVAVFPILISLGSPVSLGSLPANLVSVPLAGPTMVFGLLSAFFAQVWLPLGEIFGYLAVIPALGIVYSAKLFANQDWLVIPWPTGSMGILLAIFSVLALVHARVFWPRLDELQQRIVITSWLIFCSLLWLKPNMTQSNWAQTNWQMASCDVGQGDATVIKIKTGQAIVIDVGGDPDLIDLCLRQLGIKKIPFLLLTHFHADHVVGLPGAIKNREIGQIRISPLADPPLTTKFVYDVLAEENIDPQVMNYPEFLRIGEVELFCIWPERKLSEANNTANNSSVALLIKAGELKILIPGDIEPPAQDAIVKLIGDLNVDVLKIPHHGSRYQSNDFAKATRAKIAVVSAGIGNDYGHPAPETLSLYQRYGAKIVRTDLNGSIAISKSDQKLAIQVQK